MSDSQPKRACQEVGRSVRGGVSREAQRAEAIESGGYRLVATLDTVPKSIGVRTWVSDGSRRGQKQKAEAAIILSRF